MSKYIQDPLPKKDKTKIILCTSTAKNTECKWVECSFAHDINEQNIDPIRKHLYQLIFDKQSVGTVLSDDDVNKFYVLCDTCSGCLIGLCQGGLNCRNGAYCPSFRVCRNDLNHCCLNKQIEILPDRKLIEKILPEFQLEEKYYGCINGHHLSCRGIKSDTSEMEKITHKELEDIQWSSGDDSEFDLDKD